MTREEFDSAHAICPVCGSKCINNTLIDVESSDDEYSDDVNSSECRRCGWTGMRNMLAPSFIRCTLIQFGMQLSNGMTFVPGDMEIMGDRPLLGTVSSEDLYQHGGINIRNIAAIADNINVSDAGVSADVRLLYDNEDRPMPQSEIFYRMLTAGICSIAPAGYGRIDEGVVRDYKLIGFYLKPCTITS